MAKIAAQMVFAKDDGTNRELVFAVCHVFEMLTALKANITQLGTASSSGLLRHEAAAPIAQKTAEAVTANEGRGLRSAPLPFLLGVKCGLLSQQFSDQFFGAINRDLIAYREHYFSVPLNLCVEFDAFIAHRVPLEPRNGAALIGRLIVKSTGRENCSPQRFRTFRTSRNRDFSERPCAGPASLRRMKLALQPAGYFIGIEGIGPFAIETLKRARPFAARRQR
jgi:hypothetical protein